MGELGWIKLHRALKDNPTWKACKAERKVIMITMLLLASHKETVITLSTGEKVKILPGQFITSRSSLAEKCGKDVSEQMVRSALQFFKKTNFSTNESTNGYTLVTIINWGLYQDVESKQPTSQPVVNQVSTTIKNVKNVKNKKLYVETSNEYRLAEFLFKHIRKNNPNAKTPNLQSWAKDFDYILRLDKRNLEEVQELIRFCQNDSFWCTNILSASKFRKQYDQLYLKYKNEKNPLNKKAKEDGVYNPYDTDLMI